MYEIDRDEMVCRRLVAETLSKCVHSCQWMGSSICADLFGAQWTCGMYFRLRKHRLKICDDHPDCMVHVNTF